jgi:hypothetical protein
MPKCELKPWKIGEPQVVYVTEFEERIIVIFENVDCRSTCYRIVIVSRRDENEVCTYEQSEDNIIWSFLTELLGIPETIEKGGKE